MKEPRRPEEVCPICGKTYRAVPAISRTDGKTPICPECGVREALASIGILPNEQDKIIAIINEHSGAR